MSRRDFRSVTLAISHGISMAKRKEVPAAGHVLATRFFETSLTSARISDLQEYEARRMKKLSHAHSLPFLLEDSLQ